MYILLTNHIKFELFFFLGNRSQINHGFNLVTKSFLHINKYITHTSPACG